MSETSPSVDYGGAPDLDPSRDLTVDDVMLFQRFLQPADVERVESMYEEEIERHLRLCETAIQWAARITYYWCDLPQHPWRDINTTVAQHLREQGFKVEFARLSRTVTVQSESKPPGEGQATEVYERLTASWLNAPALDEKRVNDEWRRREVIEDGARATFVPMMQSRLEGAKIAAQGETAWAAVLDGRYVVEVQRILHQNTLCVFSFNGKCVHREPTNVSFGAAFGADGSDVATWQERAQRIVDGLLDSGNELGALPGVAEATLRLRGPSGRLHADRLAEVFGYTRAKLGRLMHISPKKLLATPESESIQEMLEPFAQIARLLVLHDDEAAFRTWLNAPNSELDGKSPNEIIAQRGPQIVADLVRDIITSRGG